MTRGEEPGAYGPEFGGPARIGTFRVLGVLGSGAMGRVFLGYDEAVGLAAVKVVRPDLAADRTYRERFVREIRAARRVSGAYTARVIAAEPLTAPLWLATEYVAAPTLAELVEACGPLPEDCVRRIAAGCVRALMDVHRVGLIHRDVKPGNILVTEDAPLLLDFGLAYAADSEHLTRTGTHPGTPAFMAPEQIGRREEPTAATDVYALGATLVFAACGHLPYPGPGVEATIYQMMTATPDLDGVPERLVPVLEACLARDPDERPGCADLLEQLAEQLGDTPLPEAGRVLIAHRAAEGERLRAQYALPADADPAAASASETWIAVPAPDQDPGRRGSPRAHRRPGTGAGRSWMAVAAASTAVLGVAVGLVFSVIHAWPTPSPTQTTSTVAVVGLGGQNLPPPPPASGQAAAPANGTDQGGPPATLTVTPVSGGPGALFTVRGSGWPPGRLVWIILELPVQTPFSVYAASDGTIEATVNPAGQEHRTDGATPGHYTVEAEAGPLEAVVSFTVTASRN